jgi:hypothetical protein
MIRVLNNRMLRVALLLGVAALAVSVGPAGAFGSASLATGGSAALTGFGFWQALGCVGCIAGFIVGAGTTGAGLAVFIAANPELGVLCIGTCASA